MRNQPTDAERRLWAMLRDRRFWNHEILAQPRDVMEGLYMALNSPSPRSPAASRPLPRGEREESGDHV
jgi:very-short-patch-repair endonuclease